jgi:hypothetical protein
MSSFKLFYSICLEELRKPRKFCVIAGVPAPDSKRALLEFKSEAMDVKTNL